MSRAFIIPLAAAAVLIATCTRSRAADLPNIDCAVIRSYVAEHGKAKALAWALQNGYSWKDIQQARKCLKTS